MFTFFKDGIVFAQNDSVYTLMKQAQELFEAGEYEQVELICHDVIKIAPSFFYAYNLLGSIYSQKKGFEEKALENFNKSISINPAQVEVYNYIGSTLNKLNDKDAAIEIFKKGLKFDTNYFYLNFNLGLLYLIDKKDAYKANEYFLKAEKQRPKFEKLLYLNGLTYLLMGDNYAALDSVTRLREIREEFLATQLEKIMRKHSSGGGLNVTNAIKEYDNRPKAQPANGDPQTVDLSTGQPTSQVSGKGKLTIKTQMVDDGVETPDDNTVRQSGTGTVTTRVKVGGTGKVQIQGQVRPVFE